MKDSLYSRPRAPKTVVSIRRHAGLIRPPRQPLVVGIAAFRELVKGRVRGGGCLIAIELGEDCDGSPKLLSQRLPGPAR